jgi:hypothetical protein
MAAALLLLALHRLSAFQAWRTSSWNVTCRRSGVLMPADVSRCLLLLLSLLLSTHCRY